jgi:hypothetical protein
MKSKTFYIKVMECDKACSKCQKPLSEGNSYLTWDYSTFGKTLPLSYCLKCAIFSLEKEKKALDHLVSDLIASSGCIMEGKISIERNDERPTPGNG